jgi:hypothetical protein
VTDAWLLVERWRRAVVGVGSRVATDTRRGGCDNPGWMRRPGSIFLLCVACGGPTGVAGETGTGGSTTGSSSVSSGEGGTTGAPTTGANTSTTDGPGSTGGSGSLDDSGGSGDSGESGGTFVPDCHTQLKRGRLAFVCNIPSAKAGCDELAAAVCEDVDEDGLTDGWEDALLAAMRPLRRFDEAEMLLADATAVMGDVGRVAAVGEHFRVYVMLGYHLDYGSCGVSGHNGDSERVVLDLVRDPEGGAGGTIMAGAYTAAHEGTVNDHGMVEICENISLIPCLDEDCAPDDVDDLALFDVLPPWINAGEEAAPRATELSVVGFPGEQAWVEQDFCGGLGGTGCSSPVRTKLTVDPF